MFAEESVCVCVFFNFQHDILDELSVCDFEFQCVCMGLGVFL